MYHVIFPNAITNHSRARGRSLAGVLLASLSGAAIGQTVSTESLLREMVDLSGMPEMPHPAYTCRQFSSYDRASRTPEDAKGWFANGDVNQYLRIDEVELPPPQAVSGQIARQPGEKPPTRREWVMMDAAGPGAIVRIWSANPAGTLRIYLDNSPIPAIECPMTEWLNGTYPGVPKPIAGEYSKGWNSYFPIAYSKHCKVTSDRDGFYYHINYRTYGSATAVQSFSAADLSVHADAIYRVGGVLAGPPQATAPPGAADFDLTLAPGERKSIAESSGPQAIDFLRLTIEGAPVEAGLRSTLLLATFDGQPTIATPAGDFFSAVRGARPYAALPCGVTPDGAMWSRWIMPFQKSAQLSLHNVGTAPVRVRGSVNVRKYAWSDRSLHFHAKWRQSLQVPTRPMIDWNYLTTSGTGVFAGCSFSIANPVKHWWGEGDEKIYVDGETFPSHFGTGTEDYFGYAWCWPGLFTHAYHNQPRCDGPGNYGITVNNRFHILDRIPFQKSFKFDMELWHWHETCKVDMSIVAFWYARPGAADTFAGIEPADLVLPALPPYTPFRVAGALEGETLRIVSKAGRVDPQWIDGCSNEQHLWWHQDQKPGDKLIVAFNIDTAGRHRVKVRCMMARDYGVHQLWINDTPAGPPRDFYNDGIKLGDEIDLGVFDLKPGDNTLTAEVISANEKAVKSYMFGLDYVKAESE